MRLCLEHHRLGFGSTSAAIASFSKRDDASKTALAGSAHAEYEIIKGSSSLLLMFGVWFMIMMCYCCVAWWHWKFKGNNYYASDARSMLVHKIQVFAGICVRALQAVIASFLWAGPMVREASPDLRVQRVRRSFPQYFLHGCSLVDDDFAVCLLDTWLPVLRV